MRHRNIGTYGLLRLSWCRTHAAIIRLYNTFIIIQNYPISLSACNVFIILQCFITQYNLQKSKGKLYKIGNFMILVITSDL